MRRSGRLLFTVAIGLAAAWAVAETVGWPNHTAFYPRIVGIPLVLLAAAETVLTLRGKEDADAGGPIDVVFSTEVAAEVAARRTVGITAWLCGFFLLVFLIGFTRAIPLFVFSFLRGQGREGWVSSIVLPALAWLGFYLLFVRLLHLPLPEGVLWQALVR